MDEDGAWLVEAFLSLGIQVPSQKVRLDPPGTYITVPPITAPEKVLGSLGTVYYIQRCLCPVPGVLDLKWIQVDQMLG